MDHTRRRLSRLETRRSEKKSLTPGTTDFAEEFNSATADAERRSARDQYTRRTERLMTK